MTNYYGAQVAIGAIDPGTGVLDMPSTTSKGLLLAARLRRSILQGGWVCPAPPARGCSRPPDCAGASRTMRQKAKMAAEPRNHQISRTSRGVKVPCRVLGRLHPGLETIA